MTTSIKLEGPYEEELSDDIQINDSEVIDFNEVPPSHLTIVFGILGVLLLVFVVLGVINICCSKTKKTRARRAIKKQINSSSNSLGLETEGSGFEMADEPSQDKMNDRVASPQTEDDNETEA